MNDYMDAYGFYDVSEDYVLEEVLADYYAGIDVFAGTEDAQADFEQRRAAVTRAAREAAQNGQTQTEADSSGQARTEADRSGQERTEGDTGQRFSREILELVAKVKNGTAKDGDSVDFGIISERSAQRIYDAVGIDVSGYSVKLEARQIRHILKDHGENGETDHSMKNDADIARIPYEMDSAEEVRPGGRTKAYTTNENGYQKTAKTVLYEKNYGEKSYYVVEAVPNTKAKTIFIVSAFIGAEGYKKEVAYSADVAPGVTSKNASMKPTDTVSRFVNNVNEKFSRDLDSRGERLTPQQAEYFRDSKVRDAQGRLKVMYHISDSGDISVFQSGNSAGLIYYAETEKAARMGARGSKAAYRVYLNAVNPVNEKTTPVNWYDAKDSITVAEWKRNGYDGVYVKDESGVSFAVFSPEQIKRTDNENPTNDPDIRLSREMKWTPTLNQAEWELANSAIRYYDGDDFNENTRYALKSSKGSTVFIVYSKSDDGTMLYAAGGTKARLSYAITERMKADGEHSADRVARSIDRRLEVSGNPGGNRASGDALPRNGSAAERIGTVASGQSGTQTRRGRSGQKGIGDSEYRALKNALLNGRYFGRERFSRNLPGETAELQDEYDRLREKLVYWKGQVKRTEVFTLREEDTRRLTKSILSGYSSRAYHGMQIKDPPMEAKNAP